MILNQLKKYWKMFQMKNDKKAIFDDLLFIYQNYSKSEGIIMNCDYPHQHDNWIGNSSCRISRENFINDFDNLFNENNYLIQFEDGSLISIIYYFDNDDNLDKFEISFIPYYDSSYLKNKDIHSVISRYIRIDFDKVGYSPMQHTLIHLHNNLERDGLRIPVSKPIYPSEFLYLIIRYYYNFDFCILCKRIHNLSELSQIELLTNEEKKLFYLLINNK